MADDEQPSWLQDNPIAKKSHSTDSTAAKKSGGFFGGSKSSTPGPAAAAPPPVPTVQHNVVVQSKEPDPPYKWLVRIVMTIINLGLAIMVAATGALGVNDSTSSSDTGVVFVGIYLVAFAGVLFAYEMVQIYPIQMFDMPMKRNFGFMYGTMGKGIYMLFMGILAFGLSVPRELAIATGVIVSFWGCLQMLLYAYRPTYFDKKEKYIP